MISLAHGRDPHQTTESGDTDLPLTPGQERFANKNHAEAGARSLVDQRMVFFYRDGPILSRRWLVDQDGRVVQFDSFARTATNEARS
jgi:hypothetical protein